VALVLHPLRQVPPGCPEGLAALLVGPQSQDGVGALDGCVLVVGVDEACLELDGVARTEALRA